MQVVLSEVVNVAKNIKSFHFRTPKPVRYTAGQFIELNLPHDQPDSRGTKRWFTLSSSPTEDHLAITTKFASEKGSTFKQTLAALPIGTELMMSSPMGDFVLPKDAAKQLVFVAGGIGITPMRSMVKYLVDSGQQREIQLLYGASSVDEIAYDDLFVSAGIGYTKIINQPPSDWQGESGILSAERIVALAGGDVSQTFYVSGPEPMVESLEQDLKKLGVKRFIGDYFPNYPA